ncbi:MAG: acyltransferase [Filimonas sp.]|nr:acyltransferase [Filimonas sp.]
MKHRFEVLDIFRGIFASMVVFFHLSAFTDTIILKNNFIYNCDLFVDFFFVLSGFVISYSYQKIDSPQQLNLFYKKRFWRLYPLHILMLFAFVAIEFIKKGMVGRVQINQLNNPNNNLFTFFSNLFMLNSVKLPNVTDVSWNIPSWSISAEVIAYLLFGILLILLHRTNGYKVRNWCFAAVVAGAFILLRFWTGGFKLTYSFDYGFLRGWIGFFTGALCLSFFQKTYDVVSKKPAMLFSIAEVVIIITMILMVYHGFDLKPYGYLFVLLFFVSVYVFSFEKGICSNGLKRVGLLKKIGMYSYSIYMTHALCLSLFNIVFIRVLKMQPSAYAYLFIVNYIMIYYVSKWTYKNVEMRFQYKKKI